MSAITAKTTAIRTTIKKKTLIQVGIIFYMEKLVGVQSLLHTPCHLLG